MKTKRNAFAILEFILVVIIVGLLAAVFIPASMAIKQKAQDDVIASQLSDIIKKADAYLVEKDLKSVSYKDLVDAKIIEPMQSVAGEKYDDIVIQKSGGTAVLKKADGKEITQTY